MSLRVLLASVAATALGCSIPYQFGSARSTLTRPVSLLRLISDPAAYDGQAVWVAGVVRTEFEGAGLYTTKEHFRNRIKEYSVSLSFDPELVELAAGQLDRLDGRYVRVEGVYRSGESYSTQLNGRIENVVQIRTVD